MSQVEGDDAPFIQVERKVEQTTDLPVDDSVGIEEGKSIKGRNGLGESVCLIDRVQILGNTKVLDVEGGGESGNGISLEDMNDQNHLQPAPVRKDEEESSLLKISSHSLMFDNAHSDEDSGTEEEQDNFMNELERFHKDNSMEFRPPKFYGEGLNYLKLWKKVKKLGGYKQVLLKYEMENNDTCRFKVIPSTSTKQNASGTEMSVKSVLGRVQRESATLAMQRCHSQRSPRNVSLKRKTVSTIEDDKDLQHRVDNIQSNSTIIDMGSRADWVKINVLISKYQYQVYALVPGLLREELQVLSDPIGRLIITGEPTQLDNPWGVTRFQKVIHFPSRIDPNTTLANLGQYGRLYVCGAFEKSSS
uniref:Uncharacterized protein n=1 Tax=Aegilops tauschii TaxID=37682 RepID=M8BV86_AEGTA